MPANFGQRPPPPAVGALLGVDTAGAGCGALASVAMYLRPGYPAGIATTVADLLILMGIIGLGRRERSTDWHPGDGDARGGGWPRDTLFERGVYGRTRNLRSEMSKL